MTAKSTVSVNLSVVEWRVLCAFLDDTAERLAGDDTNDIEVLSIEGLTREDVPEVKELARLGSGDDEYEPTEDDMVEDFLVLAAVQGKIKAQVGLKDD